MLVFDSQSFKQNLPYSPAERVTCPHVNHNIPGRQSRLTVLDFVLHVQEKQGILQHG